MDENLRMELHMRAAHFDLAAEWLEKIAPLYARGLRDHEAYFRALRERPVDLSPAGVARCKREHAALLELADEESDDEDDQTNDEDILSSSGTEEEIENPLPIEG